MRSRRQRMGQHFLRDRQVATAIADALPLQPSRVLEIGPGHGALTRLLLGRFDAVRAVELDGRLAASLGPSLGHPATLDVIEADALSADLETLGRGGPWSLAGNLPYSVGTAILRRVLPRYDLFVWAVVMVQLEVAERLTAASGTRARGLLTLETEAHSDAEMLFTVPARCFAPPPKVTSAVVRLRLREHAGDARVLERALALAAMAFTHRRKKLTNALATAAPPATLGAALATSGVEGGARAEDLTLGQWTNLALALIALQ